MKDSRGQEFEPVTVMGDGLLCSDCGRIIRVREQAARYMPAAAPAPTFRCRDCMYAEPLNEHNRPWRRDAQQSMGRAS